MKCPKCEQAMQEITVRTLNGVVTIDRCEGCVGLWFDFMEADLLKDDWMSEFLDSGDPKVGKQMNAITDVNCPRCNTKMHTHNDKHQPHIEYEVCYTHGVFMDAGEFTDFKNRNMVDYFKDMIALITKV